MIFMKCNLCKKTAAFSLLLRVSFFLCSRKTIQFIETFLFSPTLERLTLSAHKLVSSADVKRVSFSSSTCCFRFHAELLSMKSTDPFNETPQQLPKRLHNQTVKYWASESSRFSQVCDTSSRSTVTMIKKIEDLPLVL